MGVRRGPSLEPRRKPGASYGKEMRNGGPCNDSLLVMGHVAIGTYITVGR